MTAQGGLHCTHVGWKVTILVTVHDVMLDLRPNGVGDRNLRRTLWVRIGKIFRQVSINESDLGGMVEFKFKRRHQLQRATQQTKLDHLRIKLSCAQSIPNQDPFVLWRALVEHLSERLRDF